jgi:hypothetical protein
VATVDTSIASAEARRAQAPYHGLAARLVEGVRHRRAQHKRRADQHRPHLARNVQVVRKRQANACVRQKQGTNFAARCGFAQKDHADQDGEGGVGEQNQPLQAGRDVLQAHEVQNAGPVVAQQPQRRHPAPFAQAERGRLRLAFQPTQANAGSENTMRSASSVTESTGTACGTA